MAYEIRKKLDGRLARLEAIVTTGATRDTPTDAELDGRLAHEMFFLMATGSIRINAAGQWCLPMLWGAPASHVPQALVDTLNQPGLLRDFAEAVAASGDGEYTLTDDQGRQFTHELLTV